MSNSPAIMLLLWQSALLGLSIAGFLVDAAGDDDGDATMGPAAFMWPTDRPWAEDVDNVAPCGSHAAAGNRTNYPLCKFDLQAEFLCFNSNTSTVKSSKRKACPRSAG